MVQVKCEVEEHHFTHYTIAAGVLTGRFLGCKQA